MADVTLENLVVGGGTGIVCDPYDTNILDTMARALTIYELAIADGPCPKMFDLGESDLPAITASGLDPKVLLRLPALVRHAAAAEPKAAGVYELLETSGPLAVVDCEGLRSALARIGAWLSGPVPDVYASYDQAAAEEAMARMLGGSRDPSGPGY